MNDTALPAIIDTHQHLWDRARFRIPWLENAGEPLGKNHTPEDYARETRGLNVVKTVYMEVDVDPAQHEAEAGHVCGLCARPDDPMAGAVVGGRPAAAGFEAYLDRIQAAKNGSAYIKGIRQVLHGGGTPPGFCLSSDFVRGMKTLGRRGLSFDLCMRANELRDGARLADLCPDTRFILDHCGNGNVQATREERAVWTEGMTEIAKRPNVVGKVSGIIASAKPGAWTPADLAPLVEHTRAVFGPDRIFFGSDWPVCTLTATIPEWVTALQAITAAWSADERRKLFHDNAARLYGV